MSVTLPPPTDAVYQKPISQFYAPRDLEDFIAYWDASQIPASLAVNAPVMLLPDVSGNGFNMVQPSNASANAPIKTMYNGKSIATFAAASSQKLGCSVMGGSFNWPVMTNYQPPYSFIAVVRPSATQSASTVPIMSTAGPSGNLSIPNNGNTVGFPGVFGNNAFGNLQGANILDGNWHILIAIIENCSASVFCDGYLTYILGGVSNAVTNAGFEGFSLPVLGNDSASNYYNGDIAEISVVNSRIQQGEVNSITQSLAQKWGIVLSNQTVNSSQGSQLFFTGTTPDASTTRYFVPAKPSTNPVLVLWSHPQGQTEQISPSYFAYPLVHACSAQGWYFAGSSMGGASSWGSPTAQTALIDLYTDMVTKFGAFPNVILAGGSMGGIASYNAITHATVPNVKGVYGIDPTCSLLFFMCNSTYNSTVVTGYSLTTGTITAATAGATSVTSSVSFPTGTGILIDPLGANPEQFVSGAASGTGPYTIPLASGALGFNHSNGVQISDYGTKTTGYDPLIASNVNFTGLYARFMTSTGDTTVPVASNAALMIPHISPVAAEASQITHNPAAHLGAGASNPSDFIAFVNRACGF